MVFQTSMIYGGGLRVNECAQLRIQDIDFEYSSIIIRNGKGAKDRHTLLAKALHEPLRAHINRLSALHEEDLAQGAGYTRLPYALRKKYPNAERELIWQYLFPSAVQYLEGKSLEPRYEAGYNRFDH